jgi:hypothetical protein
MLCYRTEIDKIVVTNDRMNDRTILVVMLFLCGSESESGGRVAMKWLGVLEGSPLPLYL